VGDAVLAHHLAVAVEVLRAVPDGLAAPPNPAPSAPPGLDATGAMFIGWIKWILMVCGVGGLFVCGIMMAVGRRNRSSFAADGAAGIPWVLAGLTCGAVAAVVVGAVLPS
jgi:hypothetical protein